MSELLDRKDCQAIVRSIISLADELGMDTLAEGVETPEQLDWLKRHGCSEAQGFYISRPIEAEVAAEPSVAPAQFPAGEVPASNVHRLRSKVRSKVA